MSLIDPTDLSLLQYQKIDPEIEITRESVINTIELKFNVEQVLLLKGDVDAGKSTVCNQFIQKNKKHCLGVFVNGDFNYSYHENNLIEDLYRQVYFYLNSKNFEEGEVTSERLKEIFYKLGIALQKEKKHLYIVLDGFENIPDSNDELIESFFNNLPFTNPKFKFLISANNDRVNKILSNIDYCPIELPAFSKEEARILLAGHRASKEEIDKIYSLVSGNPVQLYTIKRLLISGVEASNILDEVTDDTENLIAKEWSQSTNFLDRYLTIFELIAFSKKYLSIEELEIISSYKENEIIGLAKSCSLLIIEKSCVKYTTNSLLSYARKVFADNKVETLKVILSYYDMKASNGDLSALIDANVYNESLGDYPAILKQLTDKNIADLFSQSQSLNQAIQQVILGKVAATKIDSFSDLIRLGNLQSILADYKTPKVLESEIRCHLVEGDYDSAINLASSSKLIEERLSLQAKVACAQFNEEGNVSQKLKDLINEQASIINSELLGLDKTVDLATNLFPAFPQIALKMINDLSAVEQGGG